MDKLEELAIQVSGIVGESSAAACALRELQRQRDMGRKAWLEMHGRNWVVQSRNNFEVQNNQNQLNETN